MTHEKMNTHNMHIRKGHLYYFYFFPDNNELLHLFSFKTPTSWAGMNEKR
jgi:hypothetical protein